MKWKHNITEPYVNELDNLDEIKNISIKTHLPKMTQKGLNAHSRPQPNNLVFQNKEWKIE